MPLDYSQLKTEIQNDPLGLGYTALVVSGNDQGIADKLNTIGAGVSYQVNADPYSPHIVFQNIAQIDYNGLTAAQKVDLQIILGMDNVNLADANTRSILGALFSAGSVTRNALIALAKRQGSRAEILFGNGTLILSSDVSFALRGQR